MRGGWPPIVAIACLASIAGWGPVRRVEQALGPLLAVGDELLAPLARPHPAPVVDADAAARAWSAYLDAVRGEGAVALPGRRSTLVPVVGVDTAGRRRRITIAAPEGGLPDGALVTHRGAFVGLVTDVAGDRAEVALVGDDALRPVAAEWRTAPTARPVHFLLDSEAGRAAVASRSSSVAPPEGQVAWTREVAALGDDLPAGLLLGRVTSRLTSDVPGGSELGLQAERELSLEPLLAPSELGVVTVEVLPGAERDTHRVEAERVATSGRDGAAVRIDVGSHHGVGRGAWVVGDGVWFGRVAVAGWASSVVERGVPRGTLLVLGADGRVVPARPRADTWPAGWSPQPGDAVVTGHVHLGGLVVGHVASVDDAGFTVTPVPWGSSRRVTVVER